MICMAKIATSWWPSTHAGSLPQLPEEPKPGYEATVHKEEEERMHSVLCSPVLPVMNRLMGMTSRGSYGFSGSIITV